MRNRPAATASAGAAGVDDDRDGEQPGQGHRHAEAHGPRRPDPVGDPSGQRQAGHRADARGEEGEPELAGGEPEGRLGVGDPRGPRREDQAGQGEGHEDRRARPGHARAGRRASSRGSSWGWRTPAGPSRVEGVTEGRRIDSSRIDSILSPPWPPPVKPARSADRPCATSRAAPGSRRPRHPSSSAARGRWPRRRRHAGARRGGRAGVRRSRPARLLAAPRAGSARWPSSSRAPCGTPSTTRSRWPCSTASPRSSTPPGGRCSSSRSPSRTPSARSPSSRRRPSTPRSSRCAATATTPSSTTCSPAGSPSSAAGRRCTPAWSTCSPTRWPPCGSTTAHVLDLGHTRVAHLSMPLGPGSATGEVTARDVAGAAYPDAAGRLAGFRSLAGDDAPVVQAHDLTVAAGEAAARLLLDVAARAAPHRGGRPGRPARGGRRPGRRGARPARARGPHRHRVRRRRAAVARPRADHGRAARRGEGPPDGAARAPGPRGPPGRRRALPRAAEGGDDLVAPTLGHG